MSLVGVSMGARVVWSCLHELGRLRLTWLVQDAVLIGAPLPAGVGAKEWARARAVVSGRLVLVRSHHDWVVHAAARNYTNVVKGAVRAATGRTSARVSASSADGAGAGDACGGGRYPCNAAWWRQVGDGNSHVDGGV